MSARTRSVAEGTTGGHTGAPLRDHRSAQQPQRGGTEPAPYRCAAGSAQQRADVPRAWLPPAKFRNGIWGVSHRHRPLRGEGEVSATARASGAQRSVYASGRKGWAGIGAGITPKGPSTPDNPSVTAAADSSLYTREPWDGDADCHVGPAGLLAMTTVFCHSEERSDVGIRPFYDGRWTGVRAAPRKTRDGTPGRRALRVVAESRRDCPGQRRTAERLRQRVRGRGGNRRKDHPKRGTAAATAQAALSEAESAERAAGQIRSLPDDLRVQHGVQRSEVSARPRPCSRRGCVDWAGRFRAASRCARGRGASGLHNENAFFLLTAPPPFSFWRPKKKMGVESHRSSSIPPDSRPLGGDNPSVTASRASSLCTREPLGHRPLRGAALAGRNSLRIFEFPLGAVANRGGIGYSVRTGTARRWKENAPPPAERSAPLGAEN